MGMQNGAVSDIVYTSYFALWRKPLKRAVAALIIVAMLLPLILTGCGPDRGQGSVVCRQFIQHLSNFEYDAAYQLISPDLQKEEPYQPPKATKAPTPGPGETAAPTAEPTATPLPTAEPTAVPADVTDHRMTKTEFRKRYTDIFEAMELTAITSQIISEVNGTLNASVVYRMAYLTKKAGNLIFDFTVNSEYHEGWVVMWDPSLIFPNMEWGDTMLMGTNYPDRGEIFDADGILLAENVSAVTVYCIPSKIQLRDGGKAVTDVKELFKAEDKDLTPDQLLEKEQYVPFEQAVAAVPELEMTEADVRNSLARTFRDFAKLAVLYPDEMNPDLEARLLSIPGVGVDSNNYGTLRQYPFGTSLAHLLGYAGIIQKEYLNHYSMENGILKENKEWLYVLDENGNKVNDPNYDGDSWLGYAGLEKQYEERLRGVKGSFAYIQGAGGKVKQILYNVPAVDGEDLHLTVKINLQQRAEEVIKNIVYDDSISGTVIVMDPTTGGVQAMVSVPGYDPNDFSRGDLDDEAWAAMEKDPKTPLLNRAIQGLYPPGSTFKPLVAITGLESGNMTLDWDFPEEQEHLRGIDTIWNPTKGKLIPESGVTKVTRTYSTNRRGPMNMKNCMIQSDNIYFAYLGMKIGWDTLKRYLTVMGMGEAVPFDLPTQRSQIKNTTPDEDGRVSEETMDLLAMTGYGQGELLLTPLQLATYISAFRNGGTAYAPYVIESIWQEEGTEYVQVDQHEETVWKDLCATTTAEAIRDMLEGVVEAPSNMGKNPVTKQNWGGYGTGRFLSVLRTYTCAGKTGTAELAKKQNAKDADKELAWFVAFRSRHIDGTELQPKEERLVLVMLEIDMTKQLEEWTMMKFLIAQVLLKDDTLTESPTTDSCIESKSSDTETVNTAATADGEGEDDENNAG